METVLLPVVGSGAFVGSGKRERAGESLDSLPLIVLPFSPSLPPFPLRLGGLSCFAPEPRGGGVQPLTHTLAKFTAPSIPSGAVFKWQTPGINSSRSLPLSVSSLGWLETSLRHWRSSAQVVLNRSLPEAPLGNLPPRLPTPDCPRGGRPDPVSRRVDREACACLEERGKMVKIWW